MMTRSYDATSTADDLVDGLANEIKGKVILTTGVSPGTLGGTFVESIARAQPALLILATRNLTKLKTTADIIATKNPNVKVRQLQLDLGSLSAVRKAAAEVNSWDDVAHIDVLVNNAGIMGTPYKFSPDGFESQLATNHLGHFLFTNLIMDKILASSTPRVVNITSDGHRLNPIRWDDYNFREESYNKWHAYGQSKTANMLMAISLAEKLGPKRGLLAFSVHPGVIMDTSLASHLDMETDIAELRDVDRAMGNYEGWAEFKLKSGEQGAATHVYAAFAPDLKDHNGAYLLDSRVADPWKDTVKPWATSSTEAEKLWKLSEKLVGEQFNYQELEIAN